MISDRVDVCPWTRNREALDVATGTRWTSVGMTPPGVGPQPHETRHASIRRPAGPQAPDHRGGIHAGHGRLRDRLCGLHADAARAVLSIRMRTTVGCGRTSARFLHARTIHGDPTAHGASETAGNTLSAFTARWATDALPPETPTRAPVVEITGHPGPGRETTRTDDVQVFIRLLASHTDSREEEDAQGGRATSLCVNVSTGLSPLLQRT